MWWMYALLSAVSAALTALFAKVDIKGGLASGPIDKASINFIQSILAQEEELTFKITLGASLIFAGTLV
ncbi:hypothetical protein ACFSC6_06145 [Rufibacter sediminis]